MNTADEFMPTIEVSDSEDRHLICYQSLIIPRIGDYISWLSDNDDTIFGGAKGE